ncbi:MAG: hypothetical protein NUV67_01325 [archaeon]|nr:hypothetical protein [archaeon]
MAIFSLDSLLASAILLSMLLLTSSMAGAFIETQKAKSAQHERSTLAISLSQALVKNRNEKNPLLGAAYYNPEKKRVEANVVDEKLLTLLEKIAPTKFGEYEASVAYVRLLWDAAPKTTPKKCTIVERFVLVKGFSEKKALIGVGVCEGQLFT